MAEGRLPKLIAEEFLTCKVCLEAFEQPKILDCLHTFCLACLIRYVSQKRLTQELPCPLCRQTTGIQQGVHQLRDNFFVLSLKEAMVSDGRCADVQQTEVDVIEVREIEDVVEDQVDVVAEVAVDGCTVHPRETPTWFCENCKVFICDYCAHGTHGDHTRQTSDEVAGVEKGKLAKNIEFVRSKISAYRSILSDWKRYGRELDEQEAGMAKELEERRAQIQGMLDGWHSAMTEKLKSSVQEERKEADDKIAQAEVKLEVNQRLAQLGERVLKSTGHAEWLRYRRALRFDPMENVNALCLAQRSCIEFNTGTVNYEVFGSCSMSQKKVLNGMRELSYQTIRLLGDVRTRPAISGYRYDASSISSDPHGNVVITDRQLDVIAVHSTHGDVIRVINTAAIGKPICCTVSHANEVICSRVKPSLCVFNSDGVHSRIIKDSLRKPCSVTVSKDDHLYVLDQELKMVVKFCAATYKKSSQVKLDYKKSSAWDKIAVNSHGNLYLCAHSESCVYEFTPAGQRLAQYGRMGCTGAGELYWPRGMGIDHHDNIIIADTQNNRLQLLSPRGTWTVLRPREGEGVRSPTDVTITCNGVLAVLEKTGNVRAYEYLPF